MNLTRRNLTRLSIAALALSALPGLSACDKLPSLTPAAKFNAIDITGAEYAKELGLPDTEGKVRTIGEFKGKVVVVFFGYVQCPDVCPTTMAELAQIKKMLGPDGDKLQGIFVTVDPSRDTPEVLRAYVANFGADFIALRGDNEQTKAAAQSFKVFYSRVRGKTNETYTIDHTAGSYIYDRQGRIRLFSRYGTKTEELVADLKQLLR